MRERSVGWAIVAAVLGIACATPELTTTGKGVVTVHTPPGPGCENLGTVVGKGGGSFFGGWISNDQLTTYAMNDAMNQAAARGANYLQISPPQLGVADGTTSTATETAVAFRCPGSGASTGIDAGSAATSGADGPAGAAR
ncbi:MAG TPA: DUF4156 domain-containing protein [Myxococcaceae bacterium]|nr:DUF4156 domain-containing protein [Myxococcaceae bacterium]